VVVQASKQEATDRSDKQLVADKQPSSLLSLVGAESRRLLGKVRESLPALLARKRFGDRLGRVI